MNRHVTVIGTAVAGFLPAIYHAGTTDMYLSFFDFVFAACGLLLATIILEVKK